MKVLLDLVGMYMSENSNKGEFSWTTRMITVGDGYDPSGKAVTSVVRMEA